MGCFFSNPLAVAIKGTDFSFADKRFTAKVVEVYDGDTIRVVFRYRGERIQYKVRMLGYDSPEMKPLLTNVDRLEEIHRAHAARDALALFINNRLVRIHCGAFDKYGRILATVYLEGVDINDWMVRNGHGVPYYGGKKQPTY